jgi:hypothetical protein
MAPCLSGSLQREQGADFLLRCSFVRAVSTYIMVRRDVPSGHSSNDASAVLLVPSGPGGGRDKESCMNIEKYTERSRGFIQSAQTYALGQGHQQFSPVHLLKVLLDDDQGMANGLIQRAGGDPKAARAGVEAALMPDSFISAANWPRFSTQPNRRHRRPATALSPSSVYCWR